VTPRALAELAACAEAFALLTITELRIRLIRFTHAAPTFGRPVEHAHVPLDEVRRAHVTRVSRAVKTASRLHPLRPKCLTEALAAKRMLRRRDVASTIYFGLRRRGVAIVLDGPQPRGEIVPHAWLIAGGESVTGGDGRSCSIVGYFT
jgi:hypothetical protein